MPIGHEARYSIAQPRVLGSIDPLTQEEAVDLLAKGIGIAVTEVGPTRAAMKIGCDADTISKARDGDTTLKLHFAWNTLLIADGALDHLAGHFNKALVDLEPDPISWAELGAHAAELSTAIHQAMMRGPIRNGDVPKLKRLARAVVTAGQAAVVRL